MRAYHAMFSVICISRLSVGFCFFILSNVESLEIDFKYVRCTVGAHSIKKDAQSANKQIRIENMRAVN